MQIFRSIDSNSVRGFPKNPKEATNKVREGLVFYVFLYLLFCFLFFYMSLWKLIGCVVVTELGVWEECSH